MKIFSKIVAWLKRPSKVAVIWVILLSIVVCLLLVAGFNQMMENTTSLAYCSSCHLNDIVPEYQRSRHFSNHAGVRATCSDCHVPREFVAKMKMKISAVEQLYVHLTGKVDTPEKFEQRRLQMAEKVWARMKADNSATCRSCHAFDAMDYSAQKNVAQRMHRLAETQGKTCIDCHKGITHQLPNMQTQGNKFGE